MSSGIYVLRDIHGSLGVNVLRGMCPWGGIQGVNFQGVSVQGVYVLVGRCRGVQVFFFFFFFLGGGGGVLSCHWSVQ